MNDTTNVQRPTRFGFLLVNDFTLISLSSAVEPLRMANRLTKQEIYSWHTISDSGEAVRASDGLYVNASCSFHDSNALANIDTLIVCGGRRVENNCTDSIIRFLRAASTKGIALGAICTGSYILAKAGLMDGYRCSVHWENLTALADMFPETTVTRRVYTIDRNRYTCSGGTAPVDMMLYFVAHHCGASVSAGVAEQFVHERVRHSDDRQRVPLRHTVGNQSEKLIVAVELMEANIREPISQVELAEYVNLSRRQLQRLFQRYLNCTPSRHYLQIRLQRARELLHQTTMSLVEISSLSGFVSSSHFSKSYKEFFGHSPSVERRQGNVAAAV